MFGRQRREIVTQRSASSGGTDVVELAPEEASKMLDREARRLLNVSGEEFARRWYAGEYRDCEDPNITQVAMLLPDAW